MIQSNDLNLTNSATIGESVPSIASSSVSSSQSTTNLSRTPSIECLESFDGDIINEETIGTSATTASRLRQEQLNLYENFDDFINSDRDLSENNSTSATVSTASPTIANALHHHHYHHHRRINNNNTSNNNNNNNTSNYNIAAYNNQNSNYRIFRNQMAFSSSRNPLYSQRKMNSRHHLHHHHHHNNISNIGISNSHPRLHTDQMYRIANRRPLSPQTIPNDDSDMNRSNNGELIDNRPQSRLREMKDEPTTNAQANIRNSTLNALATPFVMPSSSTLTPNINDLYNNNNNYVRRPSSTIQSLVLPATHFYLNQNTNETVIPSNGGSPCILYTRNPNSQQQQQPNVIINSNSCIPTTATTTTPTSVSTVQQQQQQQLTPNQQIGRSQLTPSSSASTVATDSNLIHRVPSIIIVPSSPQPFSTVLQPQQQPPLFDLQVQAYIAATNEQQQQQQHHQLQQQHHQQIHTSNVYGYRPSSSRLHPQYHRLWIEQQDRQEQHRRSLLLQRRSVDLRDRIRMNIIDRADYQNSNNGVHMATCVSIGPSSPSSSSSNNPNRFVFLK